MSILAKTIRILEVHKCLKREALIKLSQLSPLVVDGLKKFSSYVHIELGIIFKSSNF